MIEVKHLTKNYGSIPAIKDLNFTVEKGHIYGFLGENGAGKSTTMNIITGCLAATAGEVRIGGYDIYKNPVEAKRLIGYLPEMPPLYTDMTVWEYLTFVAEAKDVLFDRIEGEVWRVIELTALADVKDRLIKNLSKGYKQRVGIAQALINDPEIILLDEPTVGLDPVQILEIRDLIRKLGEKHIVILSSHILQEIRAVCDYLIILSHGRIVANDTLSHLTAATAGKRVVSFSVRGTMPDVENVLSRSSLPGNIVIADSLDGCARVTVETEENTDPRDDIFRLFAKRDMPIVEMNINDLSLEDVFLRLTQEAEKPEETAPEVPRKESESDTDDYTPLFGEKKENDDDSDL